ncbi:MAG: hypothetical protein ACP5OG_01570 [Candidatus Nanoarchaeia archaeon]
MEEKIKSSSAELQIKGMTFLAYKRIVDYLENNYKKTLDLNGKISTKAYASRENNIRIDYNSCEDKLDIKVRGKDSGELIRKLNSMDPIPY